MRYNKIHLGDSGFSQARLGDRKRIPKGDAYFDFMGKGDELIGVINITLLSLDDPRQKKILGSVIDLVYRVMGMVAGGKVQVTERDLEQIHEFITEFEDKTPQRFVYTFQNDTAVWLNMCRIKAREWERTLYKAGLHKQHEILKPILNRLSTLFFVMTLSNL